MPWAHYTTIRHHMAITPLQIAKDRKKYRFSRKISPMGTSSNTRDKLTYFLRGMDTLRRRSWEV